MFLIKEWFLNFYFPWKMCVAQFHRREQKKEFAEHTYGWQIKSFLPNISHKPLVRMHFHWCKTVGTVLVLCIHFSLWNKITIHDGKLNLIEEIEDISMKTKSLNLEHCHSISVLFDFVSLAICTCTHVHAYMQAFIGIDMIFYKQFFILFFFKFFRKSSSSSERF